jgi:hypothetical protein
VEQHSQIEVTNTVIQCEQGVTTQSDRGDKYSQNKVEQHSQIEVTNTVRTRWN